MIRRTPTSRRSARALSVAALVVLTAACSASVSVGDDVSEKEVERQAAEQLAATVDNGVTPIIDCPGDLKAEVGAVLTCELSVEGDDATFPVTITVTEVKDGTAFFDIEVGE
ncbi:MAG: hypothetical protein RL238_1677 [Actinomycetota bacterium]|jgi:hypothetical protein